jgi:hypothetical protein
VVAKNAAGDQRRVDRRQFTERYKATAECKRLAEDWGASEPADFLERHHLPASFHVADSADTEAHIGELSDPEQPGRKSGQARTGHLRVTENRKLAENAPADDGQLPPCDST